MILWNVGQLCNMHIEELHIVYLMISIALYYMALYCAICT